ncbi:ubiquitin-protein transferase activating protein [Cymbomonas tetramitiformis]|uniref:Ubiquitin-protein transferase activating protein n=1 Tax=Cymbomonas tetramitiformis TaxID=36881 RepID=A0AAE0FJC7_9CHLO|nr:ubiquitin-protein transferase activating protein [Cymbomonas tetramitiformis]|eukprot:gene20221-24209_t
MDRFIPSRSAIDLEVAHYNLVGNSPLKSLNQNIEVASPSKELYKQRLSERLMGDSKENGKILAFKSKAPAPPEGYVNQMTEVYTQQSGNAPTKKVMRSLPQAPERILDAPDLVDDYYLNLLDWSCNNIIAVALGSAVYLWNAETGTVDPLMETNTDGDDYVTSISWGKDGKHIAIGTNSAEVQIWDADRQRQVRTLKGHAARVGALAWNGTTLASGGRDTNILQHDVRIRDHLTATLVGHEQEVCGLKYSPSGQLASGGNDNLLHIWDSNSISRGGTYLHRLDQHQAAVKALAWCPFQSNLLATGGGTADRTIKFWNTQTGAMLNSIDTHSQVCALQWNSHEREILSSHGYSQNQLCLWKYPTMAKIAEFNGHSARVLHMAQNPTGDTIVSAAADETMRFWRVFKEKDSSIAKARNPTSNSKSVLKSVNIR